MGKTRYGKALSSEAYHKHYAHTEQLLGKTHRTWLGTQPAHCTSLLQIYPNGTTAKLFSDTVFLDP